VSARYTSGLPPLFHSHWVYTMLRCVLAATAALVLSAPAAAQLQRNFPANALRGVLQASQPPEVLLNGRPARLAPGARIRAENNLLIVSGALPGDRHVVHYTLDLYGQIHELWLLTDAERAIRPWPTTPAEAQTWTFNPEGQFWTKP